MTNPKGASICICVDITMHVYAKAKLFGGKGSMLKEVTWWRATHRTEEQMKLGSKRSFMFGVLEPLEKLSKGHNLMKGFMGNASEKEYESMDILGPGGGRGGSVNQPVSMTWPLTQRDSGTVTQAAARGP